MDVDVTARELRLIKLSVVESLGRAGVRGARPADVALVGLQETSEISILLGTAPVVDEVFERGEELDDFLLHYLPSLVLIQEETDQVFVQAHVIRVDHAVDLWCIEDPVVVNVKDQLFEVLPGRNLHLELLLFHGVYMGGRGGRRHRG